jgi:hypothetical protein
MKRCFLLLATLLAVPEQGFSTEMASTTWDELGSKSECVAGVTKGDFGQTVVSYNEGLNGTTDTSLACLVRGSFMIPKGYKLAPGVRVTAKYNSSLSVDGDTMSFGLVLKQMNGTQNDRKSLSYQTRQETPLVLRPEVSLDLKPSGSCFYDVTETVLISVDRFLKNDEAVEHGISFSFETLTIEPLELEKLDCDDQQTTGEQNENVF